MQTVYLHRYVPKMTILPKTKIIRNLATLTEWQNIAPLWRHLKSNFKPLSCNMCIDTAASNIDNALTVVVLELLMLLFIYKPFFIVIGYVIEQTVFVTDPTWKGMNTYCKATSSLFDADIPSTPHTKSLYNTDSFGILFTSSWRWIEWWWLWCLRVLQSKSRQPI